MAMKLDAALKLYIGLYVVCFLLTWLVSVPMLVHVTPQSECLLFVTPYVKYGNAIVCNIVGFLPIMVAIAAVVLIVLHVMQLRSLYAWLRKRLPHSAEHHNRPTHIFWRMVVFHGIVTFVVLGVAAIVTAGYVETCQNLHRDVSTTVRGRVKADLWGGGESANEHYDKFANDRSIDRYTNQNRDVLGRNNYEQSITCRNILTDPEVHSQLKQNHADNPYYRQYYGFWYGNDIADVGNIRFYAYRNNMILEMCLAGSWISFVLWFSIFILMLTMRHHLKAHCTDDSVYNYGSQFSHRSRSNSRMSNQSFDKMSQSRYSNYSGSQVNGSRRAGSVNGSGRAGSVNGSGYGGGGRRGQHQQHLNAKNGNKDSSRLEQPLLINNSMKQQPFITPTRQSNLLNYFSQHPPNEQEIDLDAALEDQRLESNSIKGRHYPQQLFDISGIDTIDSQADWTEPITPFDQSFDLPVVDFSDMLHGGPLPLGDEVSSGRMPTQEEIAAHHNPNRVTGRRGSARRPQYSLDLDLAPQPQFDVSPIRPDEYMKYMDSPTTPGYSHHQQTFEYPAPPAVPRGGRKHSQGNKPLSRSNSGNGSGRGQNGSRGHAYRKSIGNQGMM